MLNRVQLFRTPWTLACQAPLPMGFSRQNTRVGCHALLQGIFLTQASNLGLLHRRWFLYHLSHQGSPIRLHISAAPMVQFYCHHQDESREAVDCAMKGCPKMQCCVFADVLQKAAGSNPMMLYHRFFQKVMPVVQTRCSGPLLQLYVVAGTEFHAEEGWNPQFSISAHLLVMFLKFPM